MLIAPKADSVMSKVTIPWFVLDPGYFLRLPFRSALFLAHEAAHVDPHIDARKSWLRPGLLECGQNVPGNEPHIVT